MTLDSKELVVPIAPKYGLVLLLSATTLGLGSYLIILSGIGELKYILPMTIVLVLLVALVIVLTLKYLAHGQLKITEQKMSWDVNSKKGEINFSKPFNFTKYQAWRKIGSKYPTAASAMVCEITQDKNHLRFFVDAPVDMIKNLQETSELGIYCHVYGLKIVKKIEEHIKK